jgi:hypothetical protein
MSRKFLWIIFFGILALTLGIKAAQLDWFTPHLPLELDGKPALLFFNKERGCECELFVYNNAETQMNSWNAPMRVIRIDLDQRPDLARQYDVSRAPSLVLLNAEGQVVWKQDEGLSDESPFDLKQVEVQIKTLKNNPKK